MRVLNSPVGLAVSFCVESVGVNNHNYRSGESDLTTTEGMNGDRASALARYLELRV